MAAESSYIKNNTNGSAVLADATGTPVTLTLAFDKGDIAISGLRQKFNEVGIVKRRGKRVSPMWGERTEPSCTLSLFMGNFIGGSNAAPGTPLEFMTFKNAYSANTSTWKTDPASFKLTFTIEGTNFGDSADETVVLNDCILEEGSFQEAADGNTLSCTLKVCGSVVITNSTGTATYNEIS